MRMRVNIDTEIIFPDLSYSIVDGSFEVFNELGWRLSEKVYQDALAKELASRNSGVIDSIRIICFNSYYSRIL